MPHKKERQPGERNFDFGSWRPIRSRVEPERTNQSWTYGWAWAEDFIQYHVSPLLKTNLKQKVIAERLTAPSSDCRGSKVRGGREDTEKFFQNNKHEAGFVWRHRSLFLFHPSFSFTPPLLPPSISPSKLSFNFFKTDLYSCLCPLSRSRFLSLIPPLCLFTSFRPAAAWAQRITHWTSK